jgi:hypothetical protein
MDRSLVQATQSQPRSFAECVIVPKQAKTAAPRLCVGSVRRKPPGANQGISGHVRHWRAGTSDDARLARFGNVDPVAARKELACGRTGIPTADRTTPEAR